MPSRNSVKQYIENGIYHVYNRGVDKRVIFLEEQDYFVFLHLLKILLSPPPKQPKHPLADLTGFNPVRLRLLNKTLYGEVELLSFCLMPNHFHLLLKQKTLTGVKELVHRLCTSYSMYFNKKYEREGHLFQGIYKAVHADSDIYLLHLSRYIHLNAYELTGMNLVTLADYPYSSYQYYMGNKHAKWLNTEIILSFFKSRHRLALRDYFSYQSFVEDFKEDPRNIVGTLAID